MERRRYGRLLCVMSFLTLTLLATAQDGQVKRRLTPKENEQVLAKALPPGAF